LRCGHAQSLGPRSQEWNRAISQANPGGSPARSMTPEWGRATPRELWPKADAQPGA
jgi:hypothetical protein